MMLRITVAAILTFAAIFPVFAQAPNHNDWYWESMVNLHIDNHSEPVGKGQTVAELTEMVRDIPVTTIQVSAMGNRGAITYPSQILPNGEGNWDTPGAWKQVAANLDRKFCIYMNSMALDFWVQHPEWMRRKADGSGYSQRDGFRMCVLPSPDNNGFLEKYLLPVVIEVVTKYKPDGIWMDGDWNINRDICWCDKCKAAWQIKTGKTEAPAGAKDPDWSDWVRFHYERCYEYRKMVADAIHEIHPLCMYTSNGGWRVRTTRDDPRSAPGYVGALSHDLSVIDALKYSRIYAMSLSPEEDTPHDIMHLMSAGTNDISMARMRQEASLVMASGCAWFIWVDGTSIVNKSVQDTTKVCAEFVRDRSGILGKSYSENPIAVLASEHSWEQKVFGGKEDYFDPAAIENASMALQDAWFGVDIVNEHILHSRSSLYRTVVIPNNQREILPQTFDTLKSFVESGGLLLVMGSGMQYARGKDGDIKALLGLKRTGTSDGVNLLNIRGKTASFNSVWNVEFDGAEAHAAYRNGKVFLTKHTVGKGAAAFVSAAGSVSYPDSIGVMTWIMDELGFNPWVKVRNEDQFKHLVFSFRSKPDRLFIHVVNLTSYINSQRIEPNSSNDIDPLAVIPRLELSLKLPAQPQEVTAVPATSGVEYAWSNGELKLILTNLEYHAALEIVMAGQGSGSGKAISPVNEFGR